MDKATFKPVMIFLSSSTSRVEQSIRARTLRVNWGKLSLNELAGLLSSVCAANKLMFDIEALNCIAHNAQGIPSEALMTLQAVSMFGNITMENVDKLQMGLEGGVERLLTSISANSEPWELTTQLKDTYQLDDIIDAMFERYAKAFIEGESLASGKLSNYKAVGEILLKWKSAQTPSPSALFIMVRELLDSNEVATVIKEPKAAPKSSGADRDRGMTGTEMDEFVMSGGI
jgi:DNA polymerase III gamma/tau subunit